MKTTPQLIKHEEVELVPTWSCEPYWLVFMVTRIYSTGYQRRKVNTNKNPNLSIYSGDLHAIVLVDKAMWDNQWIHDWIEKESVSELLRWSRS